MGRAANGGCRSYRADGASWVTVMRRQKRIKSRRLLDWKLTSLITQLLGAKDLVEKRFAVAL